MPKKQFNNPAEALLARDPEVTAAEASAAAPEQAGEIKSARVTFLCNPDVMRDLEDLVAWRTVRGVKVSGAIKGERARKPSASLILNQALAEYMSKPEVQAELAEFRRIFR